MTGATTARTSIQATFTKCSLLVSEPFDVLVFRARQQIEERIETAIERAAELGDGAVDGVEGHSGGRSVGVLDFSVFQSGDRPFRDEPDAVNDRVASHRSIVQGG